MVRRESLPGDQVRLNSYVPRQPLYTIACGVPTVTVGLGDRPSNEQGWVGPYIGETLGQAGSVVHFDPLLAAALSRPTAIAITGEPGGGKTTLAPMLTAVLRGPGNGECIFRDLEDRAGRIGVDLISDEVRQGLDTNPARARPAENETAPPDRDPASGLLNSLPPSPADPDP